MDKTLFWMGKGLPVLFFMFFLADEQLRCRIRIKLVTKLSEKLKIPLIAEGRIHSPEDAKKVFECGAYAVVVGGAITRPLSITKRFISKIEE